MNTQQSGNSKCLSPWLHYRVWSLGYGSKQVVFYIPVIFPPGEGGWLQTRDLYRHQAGLETSVFLSLQVAHGIYSPCAGQGEALRRVDSLWSPWAPPVLSWYSGKLFQAPAEMGIRAILML